MGNSRFEESFKDAFSGAEVSPSEAVWTNIELSLEKESGGKMKRNLLLFQLLAAASVAFAFGIAALYYLKTPASQRDAAVQQSLSKTTIAPQKTPDAVSQRGTNAGMSIPASAEADQAQKSIARLIGEPIAVEKSVTNMPLASGDSLNEGSIISYTIDKTPLTAFTTVNRPKLIIPQEERVEADPGMVLLQRLKDEEKKYRDAAEKETARENVWASVGFGAGSYRPNREALLGEKAVSETGASYSAGISVGGRLNRRLILQGGIAYLSQSADFTSTATNRGAAALNEYVQVAMLDGVGSAGPVASYTVNSSLQFVTIPLQAGYVVVDRAFSIQVNGGVATDLFISNTLLPDNNQLQKVTQAAGKDSPYRTVTFSGLLGTEFSYRLADQYRISLNPGLRYSLSSIYKDDIAARITPVTFDVSLRVRYIFK